MWEGLVVALYIAPAADEPMQTIDKAHLVPGRGIEGDRYYHRTGTHSDDDDTCYDVTLIESEVIEAVKQHHELDIDASTPRRNIVTRGFSVNHLVNHVFRIGDVTLRGVALRGPCPHLMEMTSHKLGVALMHRGGLGAEILSDGVIHVGDRIRE